MIAMPMTAMWTYLVTMFPHPYLLVLYLFTLGGILTWAFLNNLLTPFINAVLAILGAGLEVVVSFAMLPIAWAANRIDTRIRQPIERYKKQHPIPSIVIAMVYGLLGIGVFWLDHMFNADMFAADETFVIHPLTIAGMKFWVSETALWLGGMLVGIPVVYVTVEVLRAVHRFMDRTVVFRIELYR